MSALLQTYQNKRRLLTDEVKRWKRAFRNYNLIASDCVCQIVHLSAVMQQISLSSLFFCVWAAFYDMLLLLEWWGCDSMLSQHSRCLILPIKKTHLNTNTGYHFKQTRENVKKIFQTSYPLVWRLNRLEIIYEYIFFILQVLI